MSTEELAVKKIEDGIRAIKMKLKNPKEASLGGTFKLLKEVNEGLYQDLLLKYKNAIK